MIVDTTNNIPFCLTDFIDKNVSSGDKYYHNIQQGNRVVRVRPRMPVSFNVNDAQFLHMKQGKNKNVFQAYNRNRNKRSLISGRRLYQWRETGFTQFNTILIYSLSIILIAASVGNMKRVVRAMQDDPSLTHKDRTFFRINFVLSFVLGFFLLCFMAMSVFERFHNSDIVPTITKNNFQYKDLFWIHDGNMFHMRTIILVFIGCSMLLALAETINLFHMRRDRPTILVLFAPIFFCIVLLVYLFLFRRRNGNVV